MFWLLPKWSAGLKKIRVPSWEILLLQTAFYSPTQSSRQIYFLASLKSSERKCRGEFLSLFVIKVSHICFLSHLQYTDYKCQYALKYKSSSNIFPFSGKQKISSKSLSLQILSRKKDTQVETLDIPFMFPFFILCSR